MQRKTPRLVITLIAGALLVMGPSNLFPQGVDWENPGSRQDMQTFRQFLANHSWIAGKLQDNPSVANQDGFLRESPELAQFLNAHPLVQSNFKIDPKSVMERAQRTDVLLPDRYLLFQETQNFKNFLADHPWIAGKLRGKPALANDKGFVKENEELQEFLSAQPYVEAQLRSDPNEYMNRLEASRPSEFRPGTFDFHAADYASLRAFMQNHPWIAGQLKEDPSRATNRDFLKNSHELRQFLQAHAYLEDQFKQDPHRTLDQALQSGGGYF